LETKREERKNINKERKEGRKRQENLNKHLTMQAGIAFPHVHGSNLDHVTCDAD
jgi:hypothetical protein